MVWLILGWLLCEFCVGCGKASEQKQTGNVQFGIVTQMRQKEPGDLQNGDVDEVETLEVLFAEVEEEENASDEWKLVEEADILQEKDAPKQEEVLIESEVLTVSDVLEDAPKGKLTEETVAIVAPQGTEEPKETEVSTPVPVVTDLPKATKAPEIIKEQVEGAGVEETPAHRHNVSVQEKKATCLDGGMRKEYCTTCGEVLCETTESALGHDFEKSIWELPTCKKGGYYNNICKRCGLVECVTQEPLPHQVEDITIQVGNCMEDTVIQHVCKECGIQVRDETRYTPYDVHAWQNEEIDGVSVTYCERCGVVR